MARNDTSRRRARRSADEWQAEIAAWRASGLSAVRYAKSRDLHAGTLQWWASRLGQKAPEEQPARLARKTPSFLPVQVTSSEPREATSATLSVKIVLAGGRAVQVEGGLRLDQLGALLDAVERGSRC